MQQEMDTVLDQVEDKIDERLKERDQNELLRRRGDKPTIPPM